MKSNQVPRQGIRNERRTQQERTATTKRALLDATVKCIARRGYSSTSISQILKEVEVSRGALLHHFPSKTELVAAAMNDFYDQLGTEVDHLLKKIEPGKDSLRLRLGIVNKVYGTNPSARTEFMVAARTDSELAKAFQKLQENGGLNFYPQLEHLADAEHLKRLISAFLLGNSLMSAFEPNDADLTYSRFVDMIEQYVADQTDKT